MSFVQIILVGTKQDLVDDPKTLAELEGKGHVPVSLEEGKAMAKYMSAYSYRECSAKTNFGVQKVFEKAIKASFMKHKKTSHSCCTL